MRFLSIINLKAIFIFTLFFYSCAPQTIQVTRSRLLMGHVPVNISIRTIPSLKQDALFASEEAYELASKLESRISEYQPNSEISCLNRNAGKSFCKVSQQTYELLKDANWISEHTDHAFDIRFPSKSGEARRAPLVFKEPCQVLLTHPETRIGLASLGKGFIIDAMIDFLKSKGFKEVLIDGGGDIRATGGPWKIGIQTPGAAPGKLAKILKIKDQAVATSGNYEQPGHILDARTGEKIIRSSSVTILGKNLSQANPIGTAFYILGEAEMKRYWDSFVFDAILWTNSEGRTKKFEKR